MPAVDEDREQRDSKTEPSGESLRALLSMKTVFSSAKGAGIRAGFVEQPGGMGLALFLLRQTVSK